MSSMVYHRLVWSGLDISILMVFLHCIMPLYVDINNLLNRKDDMRDKYSIPRKAIVIAYTGRLIEEKGVLQLQSAFQNIQKCFPNSYLIMAGDGVLYQRLKESNTKNMILMGQGYF